LKKEAFPVRRFRVVVPYDKQAVTQAPSIEADRALAPAEEQRLYQHHGLGYSTYDGPDHEALLPEAMVAELDGEGESD